MSETKLLQMSNITKAFASNVVLNGVDISVDEGEVVAILGENGAGKSTLIKILGGIYKADVERSVSTERSETLILLQLQEKTEFVLFTRNCAGARQNDRGQCFSWQRAEE